MVNHHEKPPLNGILLVLFPSIEQANLSPVFWYIVNRNQCLIRLGDPEVSHRYNVTYTYIPVCDIDIYFDLPDITGIL